MSLSERRADLGGDERITALTQAQTKVLDVFASRSKRRTDAMVAFLETQSAQQSRVMFDDEWLSQEDSLRRYGRLRNRQILQVFEVVLVLLVLLVIAGLCFGLLFLLYW